MLTTKELNALAKATGNLIKEFRDPLEKRLDALEAQMNEFKYVGSWKAGRDYRQGNFATHAGAIWHCNSDTTEKPGASNDWTLAVKGPK